MPESLDCVVVGAGVAGLAVARSLADSGREVVVLEAEDRIGSHSSSRNSEVIHAGIYYPGDSLKARLCVAGKEALYRYCDSRRIPCRRIGKLIVATEEAQLGALHRLREAALRNGVAAVRLLDAAELRQAEPAAEGVGALWSPSTGIVDSHAYMLALRADIEAAGGVVLLGSRVSSPAAVDGGLAFDVAGKRYRCRTLVNAAGLWATALAESIAGSIPQARVPRVRFAKGHYFAYSGRTPFNHLVYPLPSGGGLGIHATNDLAGRLRFGPDVSWVDRIDYAFDEARKPDFVAAIRRYFRDLDERRLLPGYTGIRPKLHGPGEPPADFVIQGERDHGVPGLVNLFGIESPGLTASLAIGGHVTRLLREA